MKATLLGFMLVASASSFAEISEKHNSQGSICNVSPAATKTRSVAADKEQAKAKKALEIEKGKAPRK